VGGRYSSKAKVEQWKLTDCFNKNKNHHFNAKSFFFLGMSHLINVPLKNWQKK
jgi:hypothetical protein